MDPLSSLIDNLHSEFKKLPNSKKYITYYGDGLELTNLKPIQLPENTICIDVDGPEPDNSSPTALPSSLQVQQLVSDLVMIQPSTNSNNGVESQQKRFSSRPSYSQNFHPQRFISHSQSSLFPPSNTSTPSQSSVKSKPLENINGSIVRDQPHLPNMDSVVLDQSRVSEQTEIPQLKQPKFRPQLITQPSNIQPPPNIQPPEIKEKSSVMFEGSNKPSFSIDLDGSSSNIDLGRDDSAVEIIDGREMIKIDVESSEEDDPYKDQESLFNTILRVDLDGDDESYYGHGNGDENKGDDVIIIDDD
ncbi:hypothetical protein QTN25_006179 [Entamoeba marina]